MKSLLATAVLLTLGSTPMVTSTMNPYPSTTMNSDLHKDLEFISMGGEATQFQLYMLPNSGTEYGAMCLDGSPIGLYFQPGSGIDAYNWMIYFRK